MRTISHSLYLRPIFSSPGISRIVAATERRLLVTDHQNNLYLIPAEATGDTRKLDAYPKIDPNLDILHSAQIVIGDNDHCFLDPFTLCHIETYNDQVNGFHAKFIVIRATDECFQVDVKRRQYRINCSNSRMPLRGCPMLTIIEGRPVIEFSGKLNGREYFEFMWLDLPEWDDMTALSVQAHPLRFWTPPEPCLLFQNQLFCGNIFASSVRVTAGPHNRETVVFDLRSGKCHYIRGQSHSDCLYQAFSELPEENRVIYWYRRRNEFRLTVLSIGSGEQINYVTTLPVTLRTNWQDHRIRMVTVGNRFYVSLDRCILMGYRHDAIPSLEEIAVAAVWRNLSPSKQGTFLHKRDCSTAALQTIALKEYDEREKKEKRMQKRRHP